MTNTRGTVFVEKLIAYLPLLLAFFAAWELAELSAAKLIVQRASAAAGRAAAVVLADDPTFYDGEAVGSFSGRRQEDIELAVAMVLSAHPRLTADFEVSVSDPPSEFGSIEVTVDAEYDCGLSTLYCAGAGTIALSATTTHTYQGAKYAYALPSGIGGASNPLLTRSAYRAGSTNNNNNNSSSSTPMQPRPNLPGDPPLRPHSDQCKCPGMWEVDTDALRAQIEARKDDFCARGITVAWSGGPHVMRAAEDWSVRNGGQSLEATAGGSWLNRMNLPSLAFEKAKDKDGNALKIRKACRPIREVAARHLWDYASQLLMTCAVANKNRTNNTVVRFQDCEQVKKSKQAGKADKGALGWITWERIERPILMNAGMTIECRNYATGQVETCCEKTDPSDPIESPPGTPVTATPPPFPPTP